MQKKQERYNNDVISAITNIVFEIRKSFNNTHYGVSLVLTLPEGQYEHYFEQVN